MTTLIRRLALAATLAALLAPAFAQVPVTATEEVPFITSPDNVTLEMLRLANVRSGDHVIDLGSGDGRIVILAAKRFGATGLGVEIVPELVQQSLRNAREAGVADRVDFREQDLFKTDLSRASVITMYLLPEVNMQLRPSLLALKPGTRVVSHDWDMGDWKPDQTTVVPVPDKKVGLEKSSKIHLWTVPARFEGMWCGNPALGGGTLELTQKFQEVQGRLTRKGRVRESQGRIQGNLLQVDLRDGSTLLLELAGDALRAGGRAAATNGASNVAVFTRAKNNKC
jgi:SAM-dependent methyltransferase